jgi:hypothetical protein
MQAESLFTLLSANKVKTYKNESAKDVKKLKGCLVDFDRECAKLVQANLDLIKTRYQNPLLTTSRRLFIENQILLNNNFIYGLIKFRSNLQSSLDHVKTEIHVCHVILDFLTTRQPRFSTKRINAQGMKRAFHRLVQKILGRRFNAAETAKYFSYMFDQCAKETTHMDCL